MMQQAAPGAPRPARKTHAPGWGVRNSGRCSPPSPSAGCAGLCRSSGRGAPARRGESPVRRSPSRRSCPSPSPGDPAPGPPPPRNSAAAGARAAPARASSVIALQHSRVFDVAHGVERPPQSPGRAGRRIGATGRLRTDRSPGSSDRLLCRSQRRASWCQRSASRSRWRPVISPRAWSASRQRRFNRRISARTRSSFASNAPASWFRLQAPQPWRRAVTRAACRARVRTWYVNGVTLVGSTNR